MQFVRNWALTYSLTNEPLHKERLRL